MLKFLKIIFTGLVNELLAVVLIILLFAGFLSGIKVIKIITLSVIFIPVILVTSYGVFWMRKLYSNSVKLYFLIIPGHLIVVLSAILMIWLYVEFIIKFINQ
jgi:hypothetical protein